MTSCFAAIVLIAVTPRPAIMRHLYWYLSIAPNIVCAVALVVALRRKCFNTLPWFVILLGFYVLKFAVAVSIRSASDVVYDRVLVFGILMSLSLELVVIYEVANKLILSHSPLARVFGPLPRWAVSVLLLLATVASALFSPPTQVQLLRAYGTLSFFDDLIELCLVLALLLVAHIVGVSLRSLPAGVALGLGICAAGGMAGIVMWGQMKTAFATDIIRFAAWHLCVLVWLLYLVLPEKLVNTSEAVAQMSHLEPHSQELQRFYQP